MDRISEMLKYQVKLNDFILPEWKTKLSSDDFLLAIFSEIGEFLDSVRWEWWKQKNENIENAKIELVDIWHFYLSYAYLKQWHLKDIEIKPYIKSLTWKESLKKFVASLSYFEFDYSLQYFLNLINHFFPSFLEFEKLYYSKLILNIQRQKQGYKKGEYKKHKNGIEDNHLVLPELVKLDINQLKNLIKEELK